MSIAGADPSFPAWAYRLLLVLTVLGCILPAGHFFNGLGRPSNDFIDNAVPLGLVSGHEISALGVQCNFLKRLTGMLGHSLVQPLADLQNFASMDVDLGRL